MHPETSTSTGDHIAGRLTELFDAIAHLTTELHTTNKVLADTRADQVTLRAAVRDYTNPKDRNHAEKRTEDPGEPHNRDKPPETGPRIRIDPPRFNGDNTEDWIDRIETCFDYHDTYAKDRLYLVRMLMDPPASGWFRYYRANNCDSTWEDFLVAIRHRFDPDYYIDYVGVLSKLRQTHSVQAYQASFESALEKVSGVAESTLISLFVAGLKEPVQRELNIRRPNTLAAVFALARELEARHQAVVTSVTPQPRRQLQPNVNPYQHDTINVAKPPFTSPAPISRATTNPTSHSLPVVRVSAAEKAERQQRGLCWFCEERWSPGHKCARRFLAYMGDDDDAAFPDIPPLPLPESFPDTTADPPVITADVSSIHSLSGAPSPRSLRIIGIIKDTPLQVLIDGGSTHNFIHPAIAEKLCLPLTSVTAFRVYVGNGDSLTCSAYCPKTSISLQGHVFEIDLYVLAIHGPDIVLGVQWLQTLGEVTHDYANLTVHFSWNGQLVRFSGAGPQPRSISFNALTALMAKVDHIELFELVQILPADSSTETPIEFPADLPGPIQSALQHHADIFKLPATLPPSRPWDHRIHLASGAKPVNVRPYRYPYFQKTEIERQIQEMLGQGIIRPSVSPFSSPVLLIRKKDGTFRFCIDYRALNAATVPDHFPIPTTDELFDELGAARCFSKLDLRSGYHQIRMHGDDIFKTAFRTHSGHYEFLVMPFGLTNAPSTFQAAMNAIFQPFLRKFVIVFFDDILIYSRTIDEHGRHLHKVLATLASHSFFVKLGKCSFCKTSIDYLGHIIINGGLKADETKIKAMTEWPIPTTVKQLRGFLGLTGYYRRFVARYAVLAAPLTDLLKKDNFQWTQIATDSFDALKTAMTTAPVLRLPDFEKTFYLETDASDLGVGAVLTQDGHPIAFFSKKLGPRRRIASTYHKELYAVVEAVQKWRQYLLGREFVIRSDQKSLKELLLQVIQTPDQQFYIRKLMGFKFRIEYKTGVSNRAADALSRRDNDMAATPAKLFTTIARPIPEIIDEIRSENSELDDMRLLHSAMSTGTAPPHISVHDGLLYYKRRIFISPVSPLRHKLLTEFHATPAAGHQGIDRTFHKLAAIFYWPNMRRDVRVFIAACLPCQITKYSTQKPGGLIQPLPIPEQVWDAATLDFITGLPPSRGHTVIMVVVDRLSKYAHFGPLPSGFDAPRAARLFVDIVAKHHGFPKFLLSDRDPIFMSTFWIELMQLSGTTLQHTTAYHPQTDGQTEVTNRTLEQYLRAFTFDRPSRWATMLPWAELALNCSVHEGLKVSPFQALYGREPPSLFPTLSTQAKSDVVKDTLIERAEVLQGLKNNLAKMQQRMRMQANKHRREVEFNEGDMVLLKLQPYRQHSMARPISVKLSRRFYGPFKIMKRIGKVAYQLELPPEAKIHNVFHVNLLRPFVATSNVMPPATLPREALGTRPVSVPVSASSARTVLVNGCHQDQWLIHWSDNPSGDGTWEPVVHIQHQYPDLRLEDKAVLIRGGVDTGSTESNREPPPQPSPSPPPLEQPATVVRRSQRTRVPPKKYGD